MRLPLDWLHEYCRPELETAELARRLTIAGLELERIERHGVGAPEGFVVGRVLDAARHPDADRLSVCAVDVGDGEPAQIVCGAPNVAAGQAVAVARPGAIMPDGTELGTAKLRGVESQGMILAEDELGIGPDHDGIIVLAENGDGPAPGTPLAEVLPIATEVLELETFHNRPDTLGVYGLAREVHAVTGAALDPPPWKSDRGSSGKPEGIAIDVQCPDLCPRFTARVFDDVTIAPSPPWLKARLMAIGQRPISNVVDITNYVMLLTAQPLHAFDLDRIAGGRLVVRRAADGEEVQTLDGQTRAMDSEAVIICDDDGPTSIAGVMGGARSEVEVGTTRVLMEVATWNPGNIYRTSTRLGLRSEASARFEKGLSAALTLQAQAVAARLMIELCGATLRPGTVDAGGPPAPRQAIRLRERRIESVLGVAVPTQRCVTVLRAVGCETAAGGGGGLGVLPPEHRLDLQIEEDLIEEIARLEAIDHLPATLPRGRPGARLTPVQRAERGVADALVGRGLHEVAGWSFQSPDVSARLRLAEGDRDAVRLANPMSDDQSVLRTLLLGSLLDVAQGNLARGVTDLAVFELGAVYENGTARPDESRHVGALFVGTAAPRSWRSQEPAAVDVFVAKGVLAGLLDTLRLGWEVQPAAPDSHPFLHPGRSASVWIGEAPVGWVGELHPVVARDWDVPAAAAFELDLGVLAARAAATDLVYEDVIGFPPVRQDIAVVVSDELDAAQLLAVVHSAGGELLRRAEVFDVYRGEQAGEGRVSLALALEFRAADRTLTDEEIAERRAAIAAALSSELGGELRA